MCDLLHRLWITGCTFALLSPAIQSWASDAANYPRAFDVARAELKAGDVAAAKADTLKLISEKDRPELHRLLADCEEALGHFHEAAAQYQIAARADPSEDNLFAFASELLKYHGYNEAVQVLSYATPRYPRSARLRVALGVAWYSTGAYADAIRTLCEAVDLDPNDARPLEFLGKMSGIAPELSREVNARLQHFVLKYPNNAAANYYYAVSLLASPAADMSNRNDAPKHFLKRAIALSPNFTEAHFQLGMVCEQNSDTSCAIHEFEKAATLDPRMSAAHYRLARLYQKTGKPDLAAREFDSVRNLRAR